MTEYVGDDHSSYPYSAVTYVEATFSNGEVYSGSGAVVGQNDVITASHVVYSSEYEELAESIVVYPGLDGFDDAPFGSYQGAQVDYFEIDSDGGMISNADSKYDFAVIGLDDPVGQSTGWFGLSPSTDSGEYNLTGYPGQYADDSGPRMTNEYGAATKNQDFDVFDYESIESSSGNSGGPLWNDTANGPSIVGIASTEGWASGLSAQYPVIENWIDANDSLLSSTEDDFQVGALIQKYFFPALAEYWTETGYTSGWYGPEWGKDHVAAMAQNYSEDQILDYLAQTYFAYKAYLDQDDLIVDYMYVLEDTGWQDKSASELQDLVQEEGYTFDQIMNHFHTLMTDPDMKGPLLTSMQNVVDLDDAPDPISDDWAENSPFALSLSEVDTQSAVQIIGADDDSEIMSPALDQFL